MERRIERDYIRKALDTLPPVQKQVILLAYFQGYSQSEMAKILDQPLGTVKTRVRLAMKKLRTVLEGDVNNDPYRLYRTPKDYSRPTPSVFWKREEASDVESHMAVCSRCRSSVGRLQSVAASLAES